MYRFYKDLAIAQSRLRLYLAKILNIDHAIIIFLIIHFFVINFSLNININPKQNTKQPKPPTSCSKTVI